MSWDATPARRRPERVDLDLPPYAASALGWLKNLARLERDRDALVVVLRRGLSIDTRSSEGARR
jgi:hypothetical protein